MVLDFDSRVDRRAAVALLVVDKYNKHPARDSYRKMLRAVYAVPGKPVFDGYFCTGFGTPNGFYPVYE